MSFSNAVNGKFLGLFFHVVMIISMIAIISVINAPVSRAASESLVSALKIFYIFLTVICSLRHGNASYLGENQPIHVISELLPSDSLGVISNKEIITFCPLIPRGEGGNDLHSNKDHCRLSIWDEK